MSSQEEGEIVSSSDDDDDFHLFEVLSNARQIDVLESQEEAEIVPDENNNISVSEYVIFEQNGKRVSFADLPLQWRDDQNEAATTDDDDSLKTNVFVHGSFEFKASVKDLLCHKLLIAETMKRDEDFAKFQDVLKILDEMPQTYTTLDQDLHSPTMKGFIVDEDPEEDYYVDDNDICEEIDVAGKSIFDTVCAFCDRGGNVLCCEGRCLRSFHPTMEDGNHFFCGSLGLDSAEVDDILSFLCTNCTYKQHQCYACGELGSSDVCQEVFPCVSATCGHFYHPKCAAKLLHPDNEAEATTLEVKVAAGHSFICPMHKCFACKEIEDSEVQDLQFAVCRRCPKRNLLRKPYEGRSFAKGMERSLATQPDSNLLHVSVLVLLDHEIFRELGTPRRDHIIFPEVYEEKYTLNMLSDKGKNLASKRSEASEDFATSSPRSQTRTEDQTDYDGIQDSSLATEDGGIRDSSSSKRTNMHGSRLEISDSREQRVYIHRGKRKNRYHKNKNRYRNMHVRKKVERRRHSVNDADLNDRMLAIMESVYSSFNTEEFMNKHQQFSTANARILKGTAVRKSITVGRVEASAKAARTASEKLQAGGDSLEDAKAVCGPDVLNQMSDWKKDLSVYLGPFLYGPRYTSYGRHYTKVEKLKEIVDFCCCSNDFSCLLNEKLEEVRKSCSFKNYDLFHPKNDFSFEQKDWMTVNMDELPDGSELVIGLNPPVGREASGTNKFIQKALRFRPKLIIVIAPMEARRLELEAYDLIWEDHTVLSGKSFYLPNAVDIDNKPLERYNVEPPGLYL
ncbi:Zinc finger, RING/FYVE/PHD-type [Corchorus capsularis]|uniref:Zinc finger, RING/FYVE/PHD-type n=1 Tax=Corchorus capsularis TaxID=210143 RepID=A0A1R3G4G8_COCAP|nr:Zinc finger, RING/FYVE/PHD-type [Corchorus capsularis]